MLHVSPPELLHSALRALPDITLAIDPLSLSIVDVNRAVSALGYSRAELLALGLDALLECPRDDLARFVRAADGRAVELLARRRDGALGRVSARAATSAGAATLPCVLLVLREMPEHARALEQIERLRGVLTGVLNSLEQLSEEGACIAVPAPAPEPPSDPVERLPDFSLEQYAALGVETDLNAGRSQEINARYGLPSDAARARLDAHWRDRLERDPPLRGHWEALTVHYRTWFKAQAAHNEAPASAPAPPVPAAPRSAPTGAFRALLDARGTVAATDLQGKPGDALPFKPAEVPDLSIEQYAMLTVELEAYPARRAEILGMSGIFTDATWLACEAHWAALLVADPGLRQRWLKLGADFRTKLSVR